MRFERWLPNPSEANRAGPPRSSLHGPASRNTAPPGTSAERPAMPPLLPGGALAIPRPDSEEISDPGEFAVPSGSGWAREVFRLGPDPRRVRDVSRHIEVPANFPRRIPPAPQGHACDTAKPGRANRPHAVASQGARRAHYVRSPSDRKTPSDTLVPGHPTPAAGSHARSPDHHGE